MKFSFRVFAASLLTALLTFSAAQACPSRPWYTLYRTEITLSGVRPSATAAPAPTAKPTATPAPTAAPTEKPSAGSTASAAEKAMLTLVNEDRAANGLSALLWSDELAAAARSHSRDMAENSFFSHTSPTNGGFAARIAAAGLTGRAFGENLAHYNSLEKAEAALMSSAGHRANLLGSYTLCGIGIVEKNGAYYITQWFGR